MSCKRFVLQILASSQQKNGTFEVENKVSYIEVNSGSCWFVSEKMECTVYINS